MKHALIPALLLLALAGCIENRNDSPLKLLGSYEVTYDCPLEKSKQQGMGSLDIAGFRLLGDAAALNVRYLSIFDVLNDMTSSEIKQGDQTLSSKYRNAATLNKLSLSYKTTPNLALRPEDIAIAFTLDPGSNGILLVNLVGPKAAQALLDNVVAGDSPLSLTVSAQVSGSLNSGGTITSNVRSYTIQVFDSGLTCKRGQTVDLNGPCATVGGQDTYPAQCATPDAGVP